MKIKAFLLRLLTAVTEWVLRVKDKLVVFLKRYPELLTIPLAFIVWVLSISVLRWCDPTSGIFDAGVFQIPIFAVLQLFVYVSIAWMMLGIVFGTARKFLQNDFKDKFSKLTIWHRILVSYGLFLSLLFALVALSYTL